MRRAPKWLVSVAIAASTIGVSVSPVGAYNAHVWSNSDSFTVRCLGVNDTYPKLLYNLNLAQMIKLGFNPVAGALGPGFTRASFLNNVVMDYGVYVHSHGDNYWAASGAPKVDSGFLQDPGSGRCSDRTRDMVRSSTIKTATAGTLYNVVIMSTCMLGSSSSTMPAAFQIAKNKTSVYDQFYMGYVYHTWDSASLRFEKAFWSYMNGGAPHTRTLAQAFAYATSIGGYEAVGAEPFMANWWGNPAYDGFRPVRRCPSCSS